MKAILKYTRKDISGHSYAEPRWRRQGAGSEPAWPPWMVARLSVMLFAVRSGSRPLSQMIDALRLNNMSALAIWKE